MTPLKVKHGNTAAATQPEQLTDVRKRLAGVVLRIRAVSLLTLAPLRVCSGVLSVM